MPSNAKRKPKFNETNDNIEWARWTWNPVTGCKHNCPYCYARDIAMRFPDTFPKGFEPHFIPKRLSAPKNTPFPDEEDFKPGFTAEGNRTVFVCSMADLFGEWVPDKWIDPVLTAVRQSPKWRYIFLTKNPERYLEIDFPDNCVLGATGDTQKRASKALEVFNKKKNQANNITFLSCEPLMEYIKLPVQYLPYLDWIIIGGRSRSKNLPKAQPEWEWVESLICQARDNDIKKYFKPNLSVRPREYPFGDTL